MIMLRRLIGLVRDRRMIAIGKLETGPVFSMASAERPAPIRASFQTFLARNRAISSADEILARDSGLHHGNKDIVGRVRICRSDDASFQRTAGMQVPLRGFMENKASFQHEEKIAKIIRPHRHVGLHTHFTSCL